MRLAIIPARGGSKRIPRKNIRTFAGQPIIAYSIQAALASQCFDRVIVSTDDEEIQRVAEAFGAEVPFIRPAQLADDYATTMDVIKHAIQWQSHHGETPSQICCVYATAPFIQANSLTAGLEALVQAQCAYVFSATSYPFPIQRAIQLNEDGCVSMFQPECFTIRSQDLPQAYHDAGQFYWGTSDAFMHDVPIFSESSRVILLPRAMVQDIDTEEDWLQAELLYETLKHRGGLATGLPQATYDLGS